MYSNSRNDVACMAQWYGTIAAHTQCRASVLVVFVVFRVHMYSFAGLIRRTSPPTFSDTAITDRHSDTTVFQLRAHWVWISWSIRSEKSFIHVPLMGVEPSTSCMQGEHPIHLARLSAMISQGIAPLIYKHYNFYKGSKYYFISLSPRTTKLWRGYRVCPVRMYVSTYVCTYVRSFVCSPPLATSFIIQFRYNFTQVLDMTIPRTSSRFSVIGSRSRSQ